MGILQDLDEVDVSESEESEESECRLCFFRWVFLSLFSDLFRDLDLLDLECLSFDLDLGLRPCALPLDLDLLRSLDLDLLLLPRW